MILCYVCALQSYRCYLDVILAELLSNCTIYGVRSPYFGRWVGLDLVFMSNYAARLLGGLRWLRRGQTNLSSVDGAGWSQSFSFNPLTSRLIDEMATCTTITHATDNSSLGNSIVRPPSAYSETSTAVASDVPDELNDSGEVRVCFISGGICHVTPLVSGYAYLNASC